ncbi:MAG: hypothetical protein K8S97_01760, partial [Anaerolineae bacterium]|nr:hypothetical protein [Anaerolineae bacterium]
MLEGLLVDLVPYDQRFLDLEHKWYNGESQYWATAGDRAIISQGMFRQWREEHAERRENSPRVQFGIQTKPDAAEP